jgi:hypothetical protein
LRGGPGKDFLDGGKGSDGCYPAAGGDRLRGCEDADLGVTIVAPASVLAGGPIDLSIRVTNNGARRSGPYDLVIVAVPTSVTCSSDLSGTSAFVAIWPGADFETSHAIPGGCTRQSGADPHLLITARAESASPDADASNDEATARIDISPAGATPAPVLSPLPELIPAP